MRYILNKSTVIGGYGVDAGTLVNGGPIITRMTLVVARVFKDGGKETTPVSGLVASGDLIPYMETEVGKLIEHFCDQREYDEDKFFSTLEDYICENDWQKRLGRLLSNLSSELFVKTEDAKVQWGNSHLKVILREVSPGGYKLFLHNAEMDNEITLPPAKTTNWDFMKEQARFYSEWFTCGYEYQLQSKSQD